MKGPCIDGEKTTTCKDGIQQPRETCETCPEDVKNSCVGDIVSFCGDGIQQPRETCKTCSEDVEGCNGNNPTVPNNPVIPDNS